MTRKAVVAAAALILALSACTSPAGETDKSGGAPQPLRLTLGTPDHEDQPGAAHVRAFADEVAKISDGRIEVRPQWEVAGESDDWDQRAARMVMSGDLDLAVIPARTWDTEGVDTLRPLQAPFLLISEEAVDATMSSEVADEMLAGVEAAGVTGLALFPEAFRYLYTFNDTARSLEELDGLGSRTPWSKTTFATHEALGMTPDDPNGPAFAQAVVDGDVAVVEGSFASTPGADVAPTVAVGNLPLFNKVNTLVANIDQWEQLDEGDRGLLLQAAAEVQDDTTSFDLAASDLERVETYCIENSVVSWDADEVDAAHAAVQPVYAELESDAETGQLLQAVREVAEAAGGSPVSVPDCSPGEPSPGETKPDADSGDQTVLDGTYRYSIPAEYLREGGASEHEIAINSGVLTWTLDGGEYTINWRSPEEPVVEHGTYSIEGKEVTFYLSWIPTSASPQGLPWTVRWDRRPDGDLTFGVDEDGEFLLDAIFLAAAWDRLE